MDYSGNTNKDKDKDKEPKKVERELPKAVVSEPAKKRKKPLAERMKGLFFGGEIKSAAGYIGSEVLLPALRNLLVDAGSKGLERMVYGDSPRSRGLGGPTSYGPRVTYNAPVQRQQTRANLPDQRSQPRPRHDNTEILLSSKADAELIVDDLNTIIDQYAVASVADLNALAGLPTTHIDNKWGWESIRFAEIRQTRDGWVLDLPPALPLN